MHLERHGTMTSVRQTLLPLLLLGVVIGACAEGTADATPAPTSTPSPTATSSPTAPTSTATAPPLTPTASATPATPAPTVTPTGDTPTPAPTLEQNPVTLVLRVGEPVAAGGGWTLRFDRVEDDSRCAVDVQCVWAGEATVVLTATSPAGEADEVRIVVFEGDDTGSVDGLELTVLTLEPQPRSDRPIAPGDYVVTLEARRV